MEFKKEVSLAVLMHYGIRFFDDGEESSVSVVEAATRSALTSVLSWVPIEVERSFTVLAHQNSFYHSNVLSHKQAMVLALHGFGISASDVVSEPRRLVIPRSTRVAAEPSRKSRRLLGMLPEPVPPAYYGAKGCW